MGEKRNKILAELVKNDGFLLAFIDKKRCGLLVKMMNQNKKRQALKIKNAGRTLQGSFLRRSASFGANILREADFAGFFVLFYTKKQRRGGRAAGGINKKESVKMNGP